MVVKSSIVAVILYLILNSGAAQCDITVDLDIATSGEMSVYYEVSGGTEQQREEAESILETLQSKSGMQVLDIGVLDDESTEAFGEKVLQGVYDYHTLAIKTKELRNYLEGAGYFEEGVSIGDGSFRLRIRVPEDITFHNAQSVAEGNILTWDLKNLFIRPAVLMGVSESNHEVTLAVSYATLNEDAQMAYDKRNKTIVIGIVAIIGIALAVTGVIILVKRKRKKLSSMSESELEKKKTKKVKGKGASETVEAERPEEPSTKESKEQVDKDSTSNEPYVDDLFYDDEDMESDTEGEEQVKDEKEVDVDGITYD